VRLLRYLGYSAIVMSVAFLALAVLVLAMIGFNRGFIGALISGFGGIGVGLNLILQSKGMMD
jgi:uncharacterized membrane protein (DUF485 family)